MGKGGIISEIGDGKYNVKLLYEGRDRLTASISILDDKITALATRISDLEDQIAELSLPDDADEIARLTFNLNVAKLQKAAIEKRKEYLENYFPDDPIIEAWCIDLTTGLTGFVGTAEINGEMDRVNIRPGFTDSAFYNSDRDGQMMPPVAGSPEQVLLSQMIFPGWQKWKPTYRTGIIIVDSMDYDADTCSVCLDTGFSSQQNLNINQGADFGDCDANPHSGWTQFCTDNPSHPACVNTTENDPLYVTPEILDVIRTIQALVNSEHEYESDKSGKEIGDNWRIMGPNEAGDCEDYALTKMDELVSAGIPVGNLQIVTAYTETGGYHAALMIRTVNMGNLILDNRYDEVMNQNSLSYRWDLYQRAGSNWGYYSTVIENVTIEYMDCDSAAFADGDRVIVEFENQDFNSPKIIGFLEEPKACGADFYYFGGEGRRFKGSVYRSASESWEEVPCPSCIPPGVMPATEPLTQSACAKVSLNIYIMGGADFFDESYGHKQVMRYSTLDEVYAIASEMITGRTEFAAFALSTNVFACGGLDRWGYAGSSGINDFEKYQTIINTWSAETDLDQVRWGHASFSIDGIGYIFNGRNNDIGDPLSFSNSMKAYDPDLEKWSSKENTAYGRSYAFGMELFGKGFISAGLASTSVTVNDIRVLDEHGYDNAWVTMGSLKYDPDTDTWSNAADYPGEFGTTYGKAGSGAKNVGYQCGTLAWTGRFDSYDFAADAWASLNVNNIANTDQSWFTGQAI